MRILTCADLRFWETEANCQVSKTNSEEGKAYNGENQVLYQVVDGIKSVKTLCVSQMHAGKDAPSPG